MAISIVKIVDVQGGEGPGLRKIYITGVNAVAGTEEAVAHGLPAAPDIVTVSDTTDGATGAEEPTSYREIEASRTATNLYIASVGTLSTATATINCVYNTRGVSSGSEDAGEDVL